MRLILLSLAALAVASSSLAQPRPDPDPNPQLAIDAVMAALDPNNGPPLAEPVFKKTPSQYRDMAPIGPYWPDFAHRYGAGGYAVLQCASGPDGLLKSCRVLAFAPLGWGFNEAALRMAQSRYLTIAPDALREKGADVRVAIPFKHPKTPVKP